MLFSSCTCILSVFHDLKFFLPHHMIDGNSSKIIDMWVQGERVTLYSDYLYYSIAISIFFNLFKVFSGNSLWMHFPALLLSFLFFVRLNHLTSRAVASFLNLWISDFLK